MCGTKLLLIVCVKTQKKNIIYFRFEAQRSWNATFLVRILIDFNTVVLTNLRNNCELLYLFSECILLRSMYIYLQHLRVRIVNLYQKKRKKEKWAYLCPKMGL